MLRGGEEGGRVMLKVEKGSVGVKRGGDDVISGVLD